MSISKYNIILPLKLLAIPIVCDFQVKYHAMYTLRWTMQLIKIASLDRTII